LTDQGGGDRNDELLRRYLEEVAAEPLLTSMEESRLARLAIDGDDEAASRLVRGNLRLVVALAKRYVASGVPLLDLIQDGNLGLVQAVEKYDPTRGFVFRTYATWWIRQAITRGLANAGKGMLVGTLPDDVGARLQQAWDRLVGALGRQPTLAELADASGLTEQQVRDELSGPPLPPDDGDGGGDGPPPDHIV
jgi:RNA polymerase primary sigma factor